MAHETLHSAAAKADWANLYAYISRDLLTDHHENVEAWTTLCGTTTTLRAEAHRTTMALRPKPQFRQ